MTDAPNQIVVAGDWHGNTRWALDIIRRLPELLPDESQRMILHCGDFGIWGGTSGERYRFKLTRELAKVDGVLWFVDGNHEDHDRLDRTMRLSDGLGMITDRIFHLPRGHRWVWHDRTWLALGGAVSLDRSVRVEGRSWWPQEEITPQQARQVIDAGPADVMLTHDCPAGAAHPPPLPSSVWTGQDIERSNRHQALLQNVVDHISPRHLIHGHLHRCYSRKVHGCLFVGLDCDGGYGNFMILDTRTMELRLP